MKNTIKNKLRGEWNSEENKVSAIKDVENRKQTRYGEELLEKYNSGTVKIKPEKWNKAQTEDLEFTDIKAQYIKTINKIKKITYSNKIRIYSGNDLPVIFAFFEDDEYRGAFLVAPRISEE